MLSSIVQAGLLYVKVTRNFMITHNPSFSGFSRIIRTPWNTAMHHVWQEIPKIEKKFAVNNSAFHVN